MCSMISAQCDELRSMAVSVGLEMPQAATLMMGAADAIDRLNAENAKLRELLARMAEALGIDCEWADPNWCKSPCVLEFGCWPNDERAEIRCPAWAAMRKLGVEVSDG